MPLSGVVGSSSLIGVALTNFCGCFIPLIHDNLPFAFFLCALPDTKLHNTLLLSDCPSLVPFPLVIKVILCVIHALAAALKLPSPFRFVLRSNGKATHLHPKSNHYSQLAVYIRCQNSRFGVPSSQGNTKKTNKPDRETLKSAGHYWKTRLFWFHRFYYEILIG